MCSAIRLSTEKEKITNNSLFMSKMSSPIIIYRYMVIQGENPGMAKLAI